MTIAADERDFSRFTAVKLTDAHNHLSQIVDDCQRQPIILQKHRRPRAAIVSMAFLEHALEALHGYREIMDPEMMTDDQKADLATSWPTDAEVASDSWTDAPDPAAEARRRSELRLPFRS